MKKFSKILITMLVSAVLMCASLVPALGAVNGKEVKIGSTVEYSLCISDAVQTITGIHLEFFYDQAVLELKDVNADNLPNSTINANQNKDGSVKVVNGLINGTQGLACSDKTELAKLTFEVIGEGDTDIKYYIPYMYDYDMVNLYDYTLSQTITVDNETVVEDIPPVLADDSDYGSKENFDKGDFANNEEGTGSGIKPQPTTAKKTDTQSNSANSDGDKDNTTVIVACICVAVIVGAVVVLVVAKSKAGKSDNQTWE